MTKPLIGLAVPLIILVLSIPMIRTGIVRAALAKRLPTPLDMIRVVV